MALSNEDFLDGPIPGENFTSDTRNYPWHRPPEITDYDEAVEKAIELVTEPQSTLGVIQRVEAGVPIIHIASVMVMQGVMDGRWTPDFAILISGPVARYIEIMVKSFGMKYEMGFHSRFGKTSYTRVSADEEAVEEDIIPEETTPSATGFMDMTDDETASEDEQNSMLGYGMDEEEMI